MQARPGRCLPGTVHRCQRCKGACKAAQRCRQSQVDTYLELCTDASVAKVHAKMHAKPYEHASMPCKGTLGMYPSMLQQWSSIA
eukprot:1148178-Pelagomonas_calceolata.AAC.1